ncbi:DeoR family transcriptional regulator [Entomoplasma freundtii]|uniref:DeoR family transcriptional regulator, lactose phosphotransferase system repressor n=1 Tax=Entomoplasma freundtii TaxID=74700 RepID=A0A2K8NQX7_9MOLU|nr:DeoR/GlpR family DNA-binding transcription regulator [Entomoplasma freundtii]ATZ16219.1 DeoR family transcriptional regulator, lactose phosphotransferase system repressor [Entomoplasma freundtii]TDY56880.1 DeoR family transcriptional regulator [Entomoplasma freundtii]
MDKSTREDYLLAEIKNRNILTTKEFYEIAAKKGIVNITARRDLQNFAKDGYISIDLGAITFTSVSPIERSRWEKKNHNQDLKSEIGKTAAKILQPDDIIFLTPGTTNEWVVRAINKPLNTLVTNGLEIFNLAKNNLNIKKVILLGGTYRHRSSAFVGLETLSTLNHYHFTKGFFTGTNIDEELNIYNDNSEETPTYLKVLDQCDQKIVIFDSTKFGGQGFHSIVPITDFDQLITNKGIDKQWLKKLEDKIEVNLG